MIALLELIYNEFYMHLRAKFFVTLVHKVKTIIMSVDKLTLLIEMLELVHTSKYINRENQKSLGLFLC